jgi:hypothetical protein
VHRSANSYALRCVRGTQEHCAAAYADHPHIPGAMRHFRDAEHRGLAASQNRDRTEHLRHSEASPKAAQRATSGDEPGI